MQEKRRIMARTAENVAMRHEVDQTLKALDLAPEYRAAGALARLYADQLDSAVAAEKAADRVLAAVEHGESDTDLVDLVKTLAQKLGARATVANIGPRLAELLGRLLATPKDSGATGKPDQPKPAKAGSLALLRGGKG
jgi:hypothetical protein